MAVIPSEGWTATTRLILDVWAILCCMPPPGLHSPTPKTNTASKGLRVETLVLARLVDLGYTCFLPWGHDSRSDLLFERDDGTFARVQVKKSRYKNGRLEFRTVSVYAKGNGKTVLVKNYVGQVDYFATYSPETGKCYLVSMDEVGDKSCVSLRIEPSANRQESGIVWAKDFEI